ncbi:hypothetical protein L208DRAFT_275996 [Tricholoma matsutake]|nr:hypothetical protein L208DRAFT_275996 [Tricholoma matsutake 945]
MLSPSTSVFAPRACTVYIELATSPIPREICGLSETTPFSWFSLLPTFSPSFTVLRNSLSQSTTSFLICQTMPILSTLDSPCLMLSPRATSNNKARAEEQMNPSTVMDPARLPASMQQSDTTGQNQNAPVAPSDGPTRKFRADLVTRMDGLVQDFRERKASKVETLFQILQII